MLSNSGLLVLGLRFWNQCFKERNGTNSSQQLLSNQCLIALSTISVSYTLKSWLFVAFSQTWSRTCPMLWEHLVTSVTISSFQSLPNTSVAKFFTNKSSYLIHCSWTPRKCFRTHRSFHIKVKSSLVKTTDSFSTHHSPAPLLTLIFPFQRSLPHLKIHGPKPEEVILHRNVGPYLVTS